MLEWRFLSLFLVFINIERDVNNIFTRCVRILDFFILEILEPSEGVRICLAGSAWVCVSQPKSVNNDAWHMYVMHKNWDEQSRSRLKRCGCWRTCACGICFVNLLYMLGFLAKGGVRAAVMAERMLTLWAAVRKCLSTDS